MSRTSLLAVCSILVVVGSLLVARIDAAFCHGKPEGGVVNSYPIYTNPPTFVRSVANASLYSIGQGDDKISVIHLYGDPYSMGFAYGKLMNDEMHEFFPAVWKHFEEQITSVIPSWLPKWLADIIANEGLDIALDTVYELTRRYTPSYVDLEQKGIADATGVNQKMIRRIHLIGELTKGRCSMFGLWGNATLDHKLLQLRALDWDVDGPLQNFPAVIIYHPDAGYGHAFANVGWIGWMGALTGVSSVKTGISEIGVSFPDDTFGTESLTGEPFVFLLRDMLQFDYTLDDAISRIADTKRTCHLILGFGDGKLPGGFRGFQYSASSVHVMDSLNMMPDADWHPRIQDGVYYGMDWNCPSYSEKLHDEIMAKYGNVSPSNAVSDIVALTKTGDLHVAIYDLTGNGLYVANARGDGESGPAYAYDRQYVFFDLNRLWSEPRPTYLTSVNHRPQLVSSLA